MALRRYRITVGGREREVVLEAADEGYRASVDGRELHVRLSAPDARGVRRLRTGEREQDVIVQQASGRWLVGLEGVEVAAQVEDERAARLAEYGGARASAGRHEAIAAPMPGLVVRVEAEVGQQVKAGQCLVVLQAMKMENELGAPSDGTVKQVHVEPGQAVEHGQLLVELE
jgi:pyruvate carboxylase subunit B